jgi:chromosomal replication initiation ATPase DnaA
VEELVIQTAEDLFAHYRAVKARLSAGPSKKTIIPRPRLMTPGERILLETAEKHKVSIVEIRSQKKTRRIIIARWECIYRLKVELKLPLATIGRFMKRDHTTVLHAIREYEKGLRQDSVEPGDGLIK